MKLPSQRTKREAKAGRRDTSRNREDSPNGEHSVEDLNPRGRLVKDIEMSIRSAQAVEKMVEAILAIHRGDKYETRNSHPEFYVVSNDKRTKGWTGLLEHARAGFYHRVPWGTWVDLALSGDLRRQIEDLAGSLPKAVRSKYIDGN